MSKKLISVISLIFGALLAGTAFQYCSAAVPPAVLNQALSDQDMPTLAPMLKRVLPSVVNIVAEGEAPTQHPLMQDPFFKHFFDSPRMPRGQRPSGIGSGVIIDADDGLILTNDHVIADSKTITVRLSDDREHEAEVLGSDPETDIALIRIQADNLTEIPMADSDALQVGDFVVAVGNPFGLRQTVTSGIVSGLGRSGLGNRYEDFIQTDASINPGNSGGALINLRGELVGINTAILSRSGGNIGIGFAIPTNLVRGVMEQIQEHGEVRRGQLGIIGQDLTAELAKAFDLDQTRGVVIAQVVPGTAAEKAGLQAGDVITEVNGKEIREFAQLRNAIGMLRVGDKVELEILRDGDTQDFTAIIGEAKQTTASSEKLHKGLSGALFSDLTADHPLYGDVQGALVKDVEPGSPAAQYGLRPGDVVTSVNRQAISSASELQAMAGPDSDQVLLHVRRGRGALFILIK